MESLKRTGSNERVGPLEHRYNRRTFCLQHVDQAPSAGYDFTKYRVSHRMNGAVWCRFIIRRYQIYALGYPSPTRSDGTYKRP